MKKIIFYTFKKWIPIASVLFTVLLITLSYSVGTCNIYEQSTYYGQTYFDDPPILAIGVVAMIGTFVISMFAMGYTFKKRNADFYNQAPLKDKDYRRLRIIESLVIYLSIIVTVFLLGMIFLAIKYATSADSIYKLETRIDPHTYTYVQEYVTHYKNVFRFGYYILYLLGLLLLVTVLHFVNCAIISFTNNLLDAILILAFIHFALMLLIFDVELNRFYIEKLIHPNQSIDSYVNGFQYYTSFIPVYGYALLYRIAILIKDGSVNPIFDLEKISIDFIYFIINNIILLVIIALSIYQTMFRKDDSGEYFGHKGPKNMIIRMIPHIFFLVLFTTFAGESFSGMNVVLATIVFAITSYITVSIYNRSFKTKIPDIIALSGNIAILIIMCVTGI